MLENLFAWFSSASRAQLSWAFLGLTLAVILEALAMLRTLSGGLGVQGTISWLLLILLVPVFGALAYFVLVSPNVRHVALKRRRVAAQVRRDHPMARDPRCAEADALIDLAGAVTELLPTGGNRVEILTDDAPTFERIEEAIRGARRSVWAEYYIIKNDATGRRFLVLLLERARAGVEVRLLFDAIGSWWINSRLLRAIAKAGGRVRAFQPMNPLRRIFAVHLRNHRKLVVVDGEIGFTGGMNVGDEYYRRRILRRLKGPRTFRDTHLRLTGPCVDALARTFAADWQFAAGEALALRPPPAPGLIVPPPSTETVNGTGSIVAIVPSGPEQEFNANAIVHFAAVSSARRRVYLATPYLIPDDAAVSAMVSSALRRIDVRIMVPRDSDVKLACFAGRSYYGKLLRGGVRVFEYEPAMLHAKTLCVDGSVAIVGSANADIRSWRLNFEVGAMVADPSFVRLLEERFVRDLAHSHEVTLDEIARWSRPTRAVYALARLLSPLL